MDVRGRERGSGAQPHLLPIESTGIILAELPGILLARLVKSPLISRHAFSQSDLGSLDE
jgi:hypothetical protein